jgi:hypothetical protein
VRRLRRQFGRDRFGPRGAAENENRAAEPGAGETRAEDAGKLLRARDEAVQLRRAVFEIYSRTLVRRR